jgi:hypothetical protein
MWSSGSAAYGVGLACSISYSFSMWWHGEGPHALGFQSADVSGLPGAFPQSSVSPASYQSPWITEVRRSMAVFQLPSWIWNSFLNLRIKVVPPDLFSSLLTHQIAFRKFTEIT